MADLDSEVPPLEDMSGMLHQLEALGESKHFSSEGATSPGKLKATNDQTSQPSSDEPQNKELKTRTTNGHASITDTENGKPLIKSTFKAQPQINGKQTKNNTNFGGMKKGFLFGGSGANKTKPKSPASNDLHKSTVTEVTNVPYIKAKSPSLAQTKHQFPEVQEAMKASQLLTQNKDWMTDDLLTKVQGNETLLKGLSNPTFMQAIAEFQTNPQAALAKYENNKEIQDFLMQFCGIMGDHLTKFGDVPSQTASLQKTDGIQIHQETLGDDLRVQHSTDPNQMTSQDEEKMKEILSDPEVRTILSDPEIQSLIGKLRSDPDSTQRLIYQLSSEMKMKMKKLMDVGLLQFQR